jgi:hypothetical protein
MQHFAEDLENESGLEELMASVKGQVLDAGQNPRLLTLTTLQTMGGQNRSDQSLS